MEQLEDVSTTMSNFGRKRDIRKYYKTMNDVAEFVKTRPNVNYRHFFKPSEELGGAKDELDFRNSTTWRFQEIGRKDAKTALGLETPEENEGPTPHSFAHVMQAHYNMAINELGKIKDKLF